jgi:hypothetical protein
VYETRRVGAQQSTTGSGLFPTTLCRRIPQTIDFGSDISAEEDTCAAKPWPRGNYVRIFVTQVLDIWAQAAQCCVSARGWRAHNQKD